MNDQAKHIVFGVLLASILGVIGLWWFLAFEYRWGTEAKISKAASENSMLAATTLLRQRGHTVTLASSLGEMRLDTLPDGTLVLADGSGVVAPEKAEQLLAWVRRGNTLLTQPRNLTRHEQITNFADADETEDEATGEDDPESEAGAEALQPAAEAGATDVPTADDGAQGEQEGQEEEQEHEDVEIVSPQLVEVDPVAALLGVRLFYPPRPACSGRKDSVQAPARPAKPAASNRCDKGPQRRLMLPGTSHWIELAEYHGTLVSLDGARAPLWSDELDNTVRAYQEGKGHIVMVTRNFFDNGDLVNKDHAELLLAVSALRGPNNHVTMVRFLDVLPWYKAAWEHFSMLIVGVAVLLALLFWAKVRRFGPMLPALALERRSLMEHIDASGAWLWKAEGGRELLLETSRNEALHLIRRRAPALMRLPAEQLPRALAALCDLPESHVQEALQHPAAAHPQLFTRQIRTLQTLRNHHER